MSETAALTGLATGASLGRDHARVVVVLLATRRKGDENAAASTRLPIIARSYVHSPTGDIVAEVGCPPRLRFKRGRWLCGVTCYRATTTLGASAA
jgi:hypothetical protein